MIESSLIPNEMRELRQFMSAQELAEMDKLLLMDLWVPLPGPQTEAFHSQADVLYYGGAAGGGKSDLLLGLALTSHNRSIIFRREATQLQGLYDRTAEILGHRNGFNGHDKIWRLPGRQVEWGSCKDPGSESAYQGRPHDLKGFDELPHFQEQQFRFLCGWKRSSDPKQRKRVVACGNPPTDAEGEWIIRYFAPWLDPNHPRKAAPGELRWFAMLDGKDTEVRNGEWFEWKGETIKPESRTFIRSKVQDNPYMMETGYDQTLMALPEPLRSQMLRGDFMAGRQDDAWQVIPTAWVIAAQARWQKRDSKGAMDSMGVDVARGGADFTIIARRHGTWVDELVEFPGTATPDGPTVAGQVVTLARDGAVMHVDIIGVGASVFDFLRQFEAPVVGINASEASIASDQSGRLQFVNKRAELHWKFREMLDPANDVGIALPPSDGLRADLCAPRWKMTVRGVQVESKDEIKKRIGRSPDRGDAVIYASVATPKKWNKPIKTKRKRLV